jgi:hypothetical protein
VGILILNAQVIFVEIVVETIRRLSFLIAR